MRLLPLIFMLAGSLIAGEPAYPLWDGQDSVADYAKRVNLPATKTLELGNGVKLELVLIPAGKFVMGTPEHEKLVVGQVMLGISGGVLFVVMLLLLVRARRKRERPQFSMALMLLMTFMASIGVWGGVRWNEASKHLDDFANEHPSHETTLTKPFYIGKFPVTQEQYMAVIGSNPSNFKGKDNPVETVSWDDALTFCKSLNAKSTLTVRLPTEAEWEHACRAGTKTKYYSGDSEEDLKRVAWYGSNSNSATHPVGQKEANKFGLYEMHGNVWQWCEDWYGDYSADAVADPLGPTNGAYRVLRGGSWDYSPMYCRSAYRLRRDPVNRRSSVGFRVVVVPASRTP